MGEECPNPGTAVFQRTFFDVFTSHSTGPAVGLIPDAAGPRNCGQFSSAAGATDDATSTMNMTSDRMDIGVEAVYHESVR